MNVAPQPKDHRKQTDSPNEHEEYTDRGAKLAEVNCRLISSWWGTNRPEEEPTVVMADDLHRPHAEKALSEDLARAFGPSQVYSSSRGTASQWHCATQSLDPQEPECMSHWKGSKLPRVAGLDWLFARFQTKWSSCITVMGKSGKGGIVTHMLAKMMP